MNEKTGEFIFGQVSKIMVGNKPVGFTKGRLLTCSIEDDGFTKDSDVWLENPMRPSFEITGEVVVTNEAPIYKLLENMPSKVDVEIRRKQGKMSRKMKKAYRTGSRYRRDTKWKRKAKAYERRFIYRLPNAEMVVTREQFGVLEATIKGSGLQYNPDAHVSGKDLSKALAAYVKKR